MIYLFVGEDEFSKNIKLQKIKQELNLTRLESFNFEILYSKDLDLKTLQARLLLLPLKARQRLILIKDATGLSNNIKQYLLTFIKKPFPHITLILDTRRIDERDEFIKRISSSVKLINFHQSKEINAFILARQVLQSTGGRRLQTAQSKIKSTMRLLRQLLLQGERPEKILGAFRYQLHRERLDLNEKKKKLLFLLNCDIDIKTGRLKPRMALERLLIRLCYF